MRKQSLVILLAATVAGAKKVIFESKHIDECELWITPLYLLLGLKESMKQPITVYELAETFSTDKRQHLKIEEDLHRYAKHVDSDDPEVFLKVVCSGTEVGDTAKNLLAFHDDADNAEAMFLNGFDIYNITKCLYLGRGATNYPRTFEDALRAIPGSKTEKDELKFLETYIKCLADVAEYDPCKIAGMLTIGGFTLEKA